MSLEQLEFALQNPLTKSQVFDSYSVERTTSVGIGPVGLYFVTVKGQKMNNKRIIKIYPPIEAHQRGKAERDIYVSSSLSSLDTFPTVYGMTAIIEQKNIYPVLIQEHIIGQALENVDISVWSWKEKISFICRLLLALIDAKSILGYFVHDNLHPMNIFLQDEVTEPEIIQTKMRKLKLIGRKIKIVDFDYSQTPLFKNTNQKLKFGIPKKILQYTSTFIGPHNALYLTRMIDEWYSTIVHQFEYGNADIKAVNIYTLLLTVVQKIQDNAMSIVDVSSTQYSKIFTYKLLQDMDTQYFTTIDILDSINFNTLFDPLVTTELISTNVQIVPDSKWTPTEVPKYDNSEFLAKVMMSLPFFGIYQQQDSLKALATDLDRVNRLYYQLYGKLPHIYELEHEFHVRTISGTHGLFSLSKAAALSGLSLSVDFIADYGELIVGVNQDTVSLTTYPKNNMRFIYPFDDLLHSNVVHITELPKVLPAAVSKSNQNLTLYVNKIEYNFLSKLLHIDASIFSAEEKMESKQLNIQIGDITLPQLLVQIIPDPLSLISLLWDSEALQNNATSTTLANTPDGRLSVNRDTLELVDYILTSDNRSSARGENQKLLVQILSK